MEYLDNDLLTEMSEHLFYKRLFEVLSAGKIQHPYKLSVSYFGSPYVSMATWFGQTTSLIHRTLTRQPSLIQFLNYPGYLQTEGDKKTIIGTYVGIILSNMTNKCSRSSQVRDNIAHNLLMLASSYELDRYEEILCIRNISRKIMTSQEYNELLNRRSYLPQ
jgi:hypothetical protein